MVILYTLFIGLWPAVAALAVGAILCVAILATRGGGLSRPVAALYAVALAAAVVGVFGIVGAVRRPSTYAGLTGRQAAAAATDAIESRGLPPNAFRLVESAKGRNPLGDSAWRFVYTANDTRGSTPVCVWVWGGRPMILMNVCG